MLLYIKNKDNVNFWSFSKTSIVFTTFDERVFAYISYSKILSTGLSFSSSVFARFEYKSKTKFDSVRLAFV